MIRDKKGQIHPRGIFNSRSRIRPRSGQIRMAETIGVIFIFFVIILFGIIFYYKYSEVAAKEQQEKLLATKAMDVTLKSLFLPELTCTRGEAEPEDNCFDMMKLRAAEIVMPENFEEYYFNLFPNVRITVEQIYPVELDVEGNNINWLLYDKPKMKSVEDENGNMVLIPDWARKEATYFIVALKDEIKPKEKGQYSFGVLKVEVYS